MSKLQESVSDSKSWPFAEAKSLLKSLQGKIPEKGYVLFETGYGPSGLPHIGTFGEVARTSMVRHAFSIISDIPSKLYTFSDDMDALRKVPDNIPNKELISKYLGHPLTSIPDPFGTHESFGHHNNDRLKKFLNKFSFEYKFQSATEYYTSGKFDTALLNILKNYTTIKEIILPTLGAERQLTYSPFLPICKKTNKVLQAPVISTDTEAGTIIYKDEDGKNVETLVTGGNCKLQWKADWAMRWVSLDVNYEMSGKDLIESLKLSGKICRLLGGTSPTGFTYELFLDENGEKISKSKGNGLSVEEWLSYAPQESLSMYMYQKPKTAKRLFFDVIPRSVDDYLSHLEKLTICNHKGTADNPAWHIHQGKPPMPEQRINYNILLNLASVCHTEKKSTLWHFITRYYPTVMPETSPFLDNMVGYAINYYRDFVKPFKKYRKASELEIIALTDLLSSLQKIDKDSDAESIQSCVYKVGKEHFSDDLRNWFKALYEILLGQPNGPRMGSFIALYGIEESISLIEKVINEKEFIV